MIRSGSAVGDYLRARREIVQPEDVGLPREPGRRVPGLRREEVAALAQISPEYYLRLERGKDRHPSAQVVRALGEALRLGPHGTAYLDRLARTDDPAGPPRGADDAASLDALGQLLTQWTEVPAFVTDGNLDVLLSNPLADRIGGGTLSPGANRAFEMFSTRNRSFVPAWADEAARTAAALRMSGDPQDPRFQEVVGTLLVRDPLFRRLWARQDVHRFDRGTCVLPVEPFGVVELSWQNLELPGCARYNVTTLFAAPGSRAAGVLAFVAAQAGSDPAASAPPKEALVSSGG